MIRRCSTRRKRAQEAGVIHEVTEKLNGEQISEYKEAFRMFDKDNNGKISTREIKNLLRSLGCNPTDLEVQQIVNEVDSNDNGLIDFPEFIGLMEKMDKASDNRTSARDAFRAFDETEKGIIDSKSLRETMIKALDPIPLSEIEELLASLELSNDRCISFEEFSKFVSPAGGMLTTENNTNKTKKCTRALNPPKVTFNMLD